MKFFLRMPAIVLFTITIVLLIIPYFDDSTDSTTSTGSIVSGVLFCTLVLWYFSIGDLLSEGQSKKGKFRFNSFYLTFFIFLIIFIMVIDPNLIAEYNKVIVIMTVYSIYAFFQVLFFCAKYLSKRINKTEEVTSRVGYIFLLWFFPIGIWIIQPKLNLVAEEL